MRLLNHLGDELQLSWEEDRVIVQKSREGAASTTSERRRPSRLSAQVEALRVRDKMIRDGYQLADPHTPRRPSPSDRRDAPMFAEPPWRDPDAAIVRADQLQDQGDALAEVVAAGSAACSTPEVMGRLFELEPLLQLEISCGHIRSATILAHGANGTLTLAIKRLFGIGVYHYLAEVILAELATLEIARHLERLTLSCLGHVPEHAFAPLDQFESLRQVALLDSSIGSSGAELFHARVPGWCQRLDELQLSTACHAARLLREGAAIRRLSLAMSHSPLEGWSEMTPARWPNLTELGVEGHAHALVFGLRDSGMLAQLERLDLDCRWVNRPQRQGIAGELGAFPQLKPTLEHVTAWGRSDDADLRATIDRLASSASLSLEAQRFAPFGFRDCGGDADELWGYSEQGLAELRLDTGRTTCECSAPQPCLHTLALMYRAVGAGSARWLREPVQEET